VKICLESEMPTVASFVIYMLHHATPCVRSKEHIAILLWLQCITPRGSDE
jgi:hypothetical protein